MQSANASKRQIDSSSSQQPPAKKAKASSSLSNLLKKVDGSSNAKPSPAVQSANQQMKEQAAANDAISEPVPKKDKRRIHWADGMGKSLVASDKDGEVSPTKEEPKRKSRWADRKKKDLLHEKELLLQSR